MFKACNKITKWRNFTRNIQNKVRVANEVAVTINGREVKVPRYFTVMQAIRRERIVYPSFCFHDRLSIAGNCRMCLVQIIGMPKLQIACGMPVSNKMIINTDSVKTRIAQESVLEFLLVDHPLDCPICDQGGECDLQDITMRFGSDRSRFTDIHFEGKRACESTDWGPFIRCRMNRCIHCTKCIRFASQVCGIEVLGMTGRGHSSLVGTYVGKIFLSELSGNVIDLCPVGSLVSIPSLFKNRPWELKKTNSVDVTDATGTNIVLQHKFNRLCRILPREHDELNQEWLSDKGRWAFDSLEMQRLVTPMMRTDGNLRAIDWGCALQIAGNMLVSAKNIAAVAGPYCNVETLVTCKDVLNLLGSEQTYIERSMLHTKTGADLRCAFSLNIPMKNISEADRIILIGTNPRFEAPILNVWIRQAYRMNECDIYVLGPKADYNYDVVYVNLEKIPDILKEAKKPIIFIGVGILDVSYSSKVMTTLASCFVSNNTWPVINFIPREASFAGALEVGWKPNAKESLTKSPPDLLILLGCDGLLDKWTPPKGCKIMYVGFQGDKGAQIADLVLPGCAYTETEGTFMNMENRSQFVFKAVTPPGKARSDWMIFRAISEYCNIELFYDNRDLLDCRISTISPALLKYDTFHDKLFHDLLPEMVNSCEATDEKIDIDMKTLKDYYCTDVFTYNSQNMVKAWKAFEEYEKSAYAKN